MEIAYLVKVSTLLFLLFPVGRIATKKQKIMNVMKTPIRAYPNWFGVHLNSTNGMSTSGRKMKSCSIIGMT